MEYQQSFYPPALSQIQLVDYRSRDRNAAFRLARSLASIRSYNPLPNPAPPEPEVPISYLGKITQKIESQSELSFEEQSSLLIDINQYLINHDDTDDPLSLLIKLKNRPDIYAKVLDEINKNINDVNRNNNDNIRSKKGFSFKFLYIVAIITSVLIFSYYKFILKENNYKASTQEEIKYTPDKKDYSKLIYKKGSYELGKEKSATCAACHGADGNSVNPLWPIIAGQNLEYIYKQLLDFKKKKRNNATMSPMAAPLTENDMLDLATYFSNQSGLGSRNDINENIEVNNLFYKRIFNSPECSYCHEKNGISQGFTPILLGHHKKYIIKQLSDYKEGIRANDYNDHMRKSINRLTNKEIESLGEFIESMTKKEKLNEKELARSGEEVYSAVCLACHKTGVANAPKPSDYEDWKPRISKGISGLMKSAISGKGAMPPRAGQNISDTELKSAILFMIDTAGLDISPIKEDTETKGSSQDLSMEKGKKTYKNTCFACHDMGIAGSPKLGDKPAWKLRIEAGRQNLYNSAIKGKTSKQGVMPPKGGNFDLTDEEVKAAVDFMISQVN